MKVKAAIFDIDKTITTTDTFFLFFKFLLKRFRPYIYLKLGYYFFETRVFKTDRVRVKATVLELLKGFDENQIKDLCCSFVESKFKNVISVKAHESIKQFREEGFRVILISASLDVYLKHISSCLDYDDLICTRTKIISSGVKIDGKNCYGEEKIVRLNEFLKNEGVSLDLEASYFYSDHHSDLPLLELVGNPCVVNANVILKKIAEKNKWPVYNWQ